MLSCVKDNGKNEKTAKGIKRYVIKKNTAHHTLQTNKQIYHTMKTIRSVHHHLSSYEVNKISLSCFDDKRYIHANGQTSYACDHHKIGTFPNNILHIPDVLDNRRN